MTDIISRELLEEWEQDWLPERHLVALHVYTARRAVLWARDEELEACVAWLNESWEGIAAARLHAARRPKPSSLKQRALTLIGQLDDDALATIRRALEALPE